MKFTVNSVAKSSARFGLLTELQRIPEAVLETPMLLLHTRVTHSLHCRSCLDSLNMAFFFLRELLFLI